MFDHDPRDQDAREKNDGVRDREEDWMVLGRGANSASVRGEEPDREPQDRDEDRRDERDRISRDRGDLRASADPRDVFSHDLDLPRGPDRELVHDRDRDYTLNGSESRTLSTVGAFRVVSERDLRDSRDDTVATRHLEDQGLIQRVPLNGQDRAIVLTERGRSLLENHRDRDSDSR